eukprot:TRINITY_DN1142_c0_g3_i1.p1 TRINITY_DN1142_c0_g3~~TRINITY_DN1142_c0_g3_i1.p1  ORF type:complete len:149 (-),score=37.40 TRINITY_DN1142_c0_g3_i1:60-506(-)
MAKTEVYGFVAWMLTFVGYGAYLLWAYLPTGLLHMMGVTYYPSKYWALAIPTYICVAYVMASVVNFAVNLINTEPLDSFNLITDDKSHEDTEEHIVEGGIAPIADISIEEINRLMYQTPTKAREPASFASFARKSGDFGLRRSIDRHF